MTDNVPATTQQTYISPEEEERTEALIEELAAEQAKAEQGVLKFVHRLGERLIDELAPDMEGERIRVGEYGGYAIKRVSEALGYDEGYLYTAMKFKKAFPKILGRRPKMLADGTETRESWSMRDVRLILPLDDAQRAEVVDWYSHPWQEGDYVLPASDVYLGERAPRHIWGKNKTRRDLEQYVRFLRAPVAFAAAGRRKPPTARAITEARQAATAYARAVVRVPAVALGKLPTALTKLDPAAMTDEERAKVSDALDALNMATANLLSRMGADDDNANEGGDDA